MATAPRAAKAGRHAALGQRRQRHADHQHHPGQQEGAADAHDGCEWARRLADGQAGQGHAAEGERPADRFGDGEGGGQAQAAPAAARSDGAGGADVGRVGEEGADPAAHGQEHHPAHAEGQPAHPEQPAAGESAAAALAGQEAVEQGDADGGERPPSPRRQAEGHHEPGADGEGTGDGVTAGGHTGPPSSQAAAPTPRAPPLCEPRRPARPAHPARPAPPDFARAARSDGAGTPPSAQAARGTGWSGADRAG